jgi:hypothetical protein
MKPFILALAFSIALPALSQVKETKTSTPVKNKEIIVVDASCGQCKLGLRGKSCDLAIRVNGRSYFVDGTNINDHGDAHAASGFCNSIRKAQVEGKVVDNRFKATYFKLLPETPGKALKQQ